MLSSPFPYDFPVIGESFAELFPMLQCNGVTMEEATINQLQDAMGKRQLTSVQLAMCYLEIIRQTDEYVKQILEFLLRVHVLPKPFFGFYRANP